MEWIYLSVGIMAGLVMGWLLGKKVTSSRIERVTAEANTRYAELENRLVSLQAGSDARLQSAQEALQLKQQDNQLLKENLAMLNDELNNSRQQYASVKANYDAARQNLV